MIIPWNPWNKFSIDIEKNLLLFKNQMAFSSIIFIEKISKKKKLLLKYHKNIKIIISNTLLIYLWLSKPL